MRDSERQMQKFKLNISGTGVAAAVGAGLASALLSLMPALKSPGGMSIQLDAMPPVTMVAYLMAFVAPLPIMVASFGFGSIAGLMAAIVGALAVGIVDLRPDTFAALHLHRLESGGLQTVLFAVSYGLPSWLLARAALRPARVPKAEAMGRIRPEEAKLGLVIALACAFAAFGTVLDIGVAITTHGGFQAFMTKSADQIAPLLSAKASLPKGIDAHQLATRFIFSAVAFMAAAEFLLLVVNLWLAARIAQVSGLLATAWPDIPSALRVPRPLAVALAVALGLSFAGGPVGMVGVIVSGVLLMAFVCQGLSVVHGVTRGKSFRLPLLIIVYLTLLWTVALYGLLGLIDAGFAFRDRQKPIVKKKS